MPFNISNIISNTLSIDKNEINELNKIIQTHTHIYHRHKQQDQTSQKIKQ